MFRRETLLLHCPGRARKQKNGASHFNNANASGRNTWGVYKISRTTGAVM